MQTLTIYKGIIITITKNGNYKWFYNQEEHIDTNIHAAKRNITRTIKFYNQQNKQNENLI